MTTEVGFKIHTPTGKEIAIPVQVDAASDPYPCLDNPDQIRAYYDREGYVVVRNLIPEELCDRARATFDTEIKATNTPVYRQSTAPETNRLTDHGYVINPLLNVQDIRKEQFPHFKDAALNVMTHDNMATALQAMLGEPGKLVQSMYFEGNPATPAHQDSYYLDASELGRLVAAWIALEDIHPGAGRFYVYPGSHSIDMAKNSGGFDIAFNHDKYKQLVLDIIEQEGLECRAPALRKGDVLFWNSKTIHGSLETRTPSISRSSLTVHYIPDSTGFVTFQKKQNALNLRQFNSFQVHCPKDQSQLKNRAIFYIETRFPKAFKFVKRLALKLLLG